MDNFLCEKKVDWSLLKEGFTLPQKSYSLLREKTALPLAIGDKHTINIVINGISFVALLTNPTFDKKKYPNHKEHIQIRYSINSEISQYFKKIFETSYKIITTQKNAKRQIVKSHKPEFLRLYTSDKPNTLIGEAVVWDDNNTEITALSKEKYFSAVEFQNVITAYKTVFVSKQWPNEKYKWIAVKHFQENWDINASDFAAMLKNALAKTGNLLVSAGRFPGKMIEEFADVAPEQVRSMFRELFDETLDLCQRVKSFKEKSQPLLDIHGKNALNHYQDENVIFTYLWLKYPEKYFIYKISSIKKVAEVLHSDLIFKNGKYDENINNFLELYNAIRQELLKDDELKALLQSQLTEDCYADENLCTLTIDFSHYIRRKYNPENEEKENSGADLTASLETVENNPANFWWLNANPKMWSMSATPIGEVQDYTLYNDKQHKRRIFQNFLDAQVGDMIIGYESTPVKQIVALFQIAKAQDGERIYFKKIEHLASPVDLSVLQAQPELAEMEFFKNSQASLLKLSAAEYDCILNLIRDVNPLPQVRKIEKYDLERFFSEVFMTSAKYESMVRILKAKKNIILQGAPGVGKTFAAKRLAYSIMGEKDDSRIEFVQFHQNYSYEDFVMGYKPNDNGFELKKGIFYSFCQKAASEPEKDYFFIIDEINRGNMSKIFGELLMLIEKDYRGTSLTLAYDGLPFRVPKNLHIIGMMNTADRSLAMIDYALRRRFSFFDMEPGFESDGFKAYQSGLNSEKLDKLVDEIKSLNNAIAEDKSLGKEFCIGHSYLCGEEICTDEWLQSVVVYDILPMLAEYWFDELDKYKEWKKRLTDAVK